MSKFNELMQSLVDLSYEGLMTMAKDSLKKVLPACKEMHPEDNGFIVFFTLLLAAIGADSKLTAKETEFVSELTGFSAEQIDKMTDLYDGDEEDLVNKFHDVMDSDTGAAIFQLVACICACDETITREESAYLKKLIER